MAPGFVGNAPDKAIEQTPIGAGRRYAVGQWSGAAHRERQAY